MKILKLSHLAQFIFCLTILSACSGGSSSSSPETTTVSGTVFAGPASGSSVILKTVSGTTVAGPVQTASDGTFVVSIPNAALASALVFEATGGTYTDEATGTTGVTLGTFSSICDAGSLSAGRQVTIDPSTTIIRELLRTRTRTQAEAAFSNAFGFTPDSTVKPVFAGISTASTTAQRLAGLRAAAFSQLCKDLGISPSKQHELVLALAEDLADDNLDGMKSGGSGVTTASGVAIPADIGNRFSNALMAFQLDSTLNRSKLKPDQIGAPVFNKVAYSASYKVEYVEGSMAATTGKTMFKLRLTNRSDNTPAIGKGVTLRPYMYMSTKSHTTPMGDVTDNGDGTYSCTVYYVMSTAMNGVSMGVWELKVTIDGTEVVKFYPVVGMPMGTTKLVKLNGVTDAIMGMAGLEKRTWFLFYDGLSANMGGSYTFNLFLATKEMGAMLTFPAVKVGDSLNNEAGTPWTVTSIVVDVSTDKSTWIPATDLGTGHWSVSGLTGLTAGTAGSIFVRLTVNGEQKTTDGVALGTENGYQTFTVTPMAMP